MGIRLGPLLKGVVSFLPVGRLWSDRHIVLPAPQATYFYGVWLKHLAILAGHGLTAPPRVLVEIGPGASLGTGLAALLGGAEQYYAVDLVRMAVLDRDQIQLEQLRYMLTHRHGLPSGGWPVCDDSLDEGRFPARILTEEILRRALQQNRVDEITRALFTTDSRVDGIVCRYVAPWDGANVLPVATADVVLAHTVMQHVDDFTGAYAAIFRWLRPGGLASLQLDFTSMNVTKAWNGHWALPEWVWAAIRGRRPFLINREPLSVHLAALNAAGLSPVCVMTRRRYDGITRQQLAAKWRRLDDEDLYCSDAFIVAKKNL